MGGRRSGGPGVRGSKSIAHPCIPPAVVLPRPDSSYSIRSTLAPRSVVVVAEITNRPSTTPPHASRAYNSPIVALNYNNAAPVVPQPDAASGGVERYEYAPYGERTVYISPGSNDPDCHAPTLLPQRVNVAGTAQPYAINDTGFQGKQHCDVSGLIHHHRRDWHPRFGKWVVRDYLLYPDGMNAYAGYHILHGGLDPSGRFVVVVVPTVVEALKSLAISVIVVYHLSGAAASNTQPDWANPPGTVDLSQFLLPKLQLLKPEIIWEGKGVRNLIRVIADLGVPLCPLSADVSSEKVPGTFC